MRKLLLKITCVAAVIVMLTGVTASAADVPTIESADGYTASLYLSDWVDGGVVLRGIKPVKESPETLAAAKKLEYTEIPIFEGNIYDKNGKQLDLESLAWYLDMEVKFVAAALDNDSYRIIYLVTQ